jgi:hypothetical protein
VVRKARKAQPPPPPMHLRRRSGRVPMATERYKDGATEVELGLEKEARKGSGGAGQRMCGKRKRAMCNHGECTKFAQYYNKCVAHGGRKR